MASDNESKNLSLVSIASVTQGAYYLLTGIWPLVSAETFQKVTGPKTDFWLVKTVGILVAIIGAVVSFTAIRGRSDPRTSILAIGSAAGLGLVDLVYVIKRRISPIYLLDAAAELALIGLWLIGLRQQRDSTANPIVIQERRPHFD